MTDEILLAYVEDCLPGDATASRVALAERLGLAIEVPWGGEVDEAALRGGQVTLATLQAFAMHDVHPLHPDASVRERGAAHLRDTLETAARWGVPRVLSVCGFGQQTCADPEETCRDFFAEAVPVARDLGVHLMIELLSPLRSSAMCQPAPMQRLLAALDAPDVVRSVIDIGHLADAGHDAAAVLSAWGHPVEELQLRGKGSVPPASDLPLASLLGCLPAPPAVVCVEHRTPIGMDELQRLVAHLRRELEVFAGRSSGG